MGYPMTYSRVISRNHLSGDYNNPWPSPTPDPVQACRDLIAGDLRRLELDSQNEQHLAAYACQAGITKAQAKTLLGALFGDGPDGI